ncbi:tryptophan halogenase family protein [Asticcacaulis sp. AND118]|uniref:tryptophan halogenase family protein n=1 Tax=Asticcacaulis sp. AND118 TaxID=2840468 RepID=UPI001CFFADA8|nr:tryptophan halogenase family protein [Asticcacaulis sp. AND118]UDF03087.1 tryptophan 7-halogenase [Asticcacaulis sp. AND118]
MPEVIRKIIVAGGGTAGWMCAAALRKGLGGTVDILLIESEDIGTVGVGEATIPPIRKFLEHVGIDEGAFIRATEASFKLGIEFKGWGAADSRYFHGFGDFGAVHEAVRPYQLWRRLREAGEEAPLEDWSLPTALARAGKFFPPNPDPRSPMHDYAYAYHFDAGLFARFLRQHCEAQGVRRLNAKIDTVQLRPEDGFIEALQLDTGTTEAADFFIDCTGFRGLLIDGALKAGFDDWTHWLPADRAWAVPTEKNPAGITPYTSSMAHAAGWQWRIPLQHRTGNGHVFCSAFMDEETARDVLLQNLDTPPLKDPMLIRFITGRRPEPWKKNCVAVGLSSGFLEPLESTSINLIQSGIAQFLELFPSRQAEEVLRREYNRQMGLSYERVRDFIILHYKLNTRPEPLWRQCAEMSIPDTLAHKIELFAARGDVVKYDWDHFAEPSWIAVLNGQGVVSRFADPLAERLPLEGVRALMRQRRETIAQVARQLPAHADFIAQHCPSPNYLKGKA